LIDRTVELGYLEKMLLRTSAAQKVRLGKLLRATGQIWGAVFYGLTFFAVLYMACRFSGTEIPR